MKGTAQKMKSIKKFSVNVTKSAGNLYSLYFYFIKFWLNDL